MKKLTIVLGVASLGVVGMALADPTMTELTNDNGAPYSVATLGDNSCAVTNNGTNKGNQVECAYAGPSFTVTYQRKHGTQVQAQVNDPNINLGTGTIYHPYLFVEVFDNEASCLGVRDDLNRGTLTNPKTVSLAYTCHAFGSGGGWYGYGVGAN